MAKIHVNLGDDSYDILIERGLIDKVGPMIKELTDADRVVVITEDSVGKQYAAKLSKTLLAAKNLAVRFIIEEVSQVRSKGLQDVHKRRNRRGSLFPLHLGDEALR